MASKDDTPDTPGAIFDSVAPMSAFFEMQGKAMQDLFARTLPGGAGDSAEPSSLSAMMPKAGETGDLEEWAKAGAELQQLWLEFLTGQAKSAAERATKDKNLLDPAQWLTIAQGMAKQLPTPSFETHTKLAAESLQLWQGVIQNALSGAGGAQDGSSVLTSTLPRKDRRFSDPAWSENPAFALLHQTYLMLAEYFREAAQNMDGLSSEKKMQLQFAVTPLPKR